MIRMISVAALTLLLVFVLYLPAVHPPERFVAQVRREHLLQIAFWGVDRADRILARALSTVEEVRAVSPVPDPVQAPRSDRMAQAVSQEMDRVNERFFANRYFRSINALVFLAAYRVHALLAWWPAEAFIGGTLLADGLFVRAIRSREFKPHDPERFALHACACILVACAAIIAFVVPVAVTPATLGLLVPIASAFAGRAIANFHNTG